MAQNAQNNLFIDASTCHLFAIQGSCFVVFGADETAKKFLETPDVKYGDVALLREYKYVTACYIVQLKLVCY